MRDQKLSSEAESMRAFVPDDIVMNIVGWNNLGGPSGCSKRIVHGVENYIGRLSHAGGLHALPRVSVAQRIDQSRREDGGQTGGKTLAVV